MKELEKIEKVLFQNQHVFHYVDEYKSVAKKIYKLFAELEKELDELRRKSKAQARLINLLDKGKPKTKI